MKALAVEALLIWLIVGILAGYLVGEILPNYGFGHEGNILVGMLGALIAGYFFPRLHWFPGAEYVGYVLSATGGAILLLFVIQYIRVRL